MGKAVKNLDIASYKHVFKRMASTLKRSLSILMLGVLFMLLFSFFNTAPAWIINDVINALNENENIDVKQFLYFGLFIIGLYGLKGISYFGQNYFMSILGQSVLHDFREQLFVKLVNLPLRFFNKNPSGQIVNRFTSDLQIIDQALYVAISGPLRDIPQIIILMGIMLYRSWEMFLLTFLILPLSAQIINWIYKKNQSVTNTRLQKFDELINILVETINGVRVIKSFGMERYEINKFFRANNSVFRFFRKNYIINSYSTPIIELIGAIAAAVILTYGGYLYKNGLWTGGEFASYLVAFFMLSNPLKKLNGCFLKIGEAVVAASRVFTMMDERNPILDSNIDKPKINPLSQEIRIRINRFSYDDAIKDDKTVETETVLSDIDLTVKANQMVAFVGSSGCGKTTIVNLIPRFFDLHPEQGTITIDGVNIRDVDVHSLREQISIVTQETILFNDTVKNNIRYGSPLCDDSSVEKAALHANAQGFIENLPEKYDQNIGEKGYSLSGGEKQRLAIARALLKDAPILILDEATSNLDNESELAVQKAIDNLINRKTTFIIAHRLSTIQKADIICVMKNGQIVDTGTHQELLKREGEYKKLYDIQFRD